MEIQDTIGNYKTRDSSRTILQPNNTTNELHETTYTKKINEQETTSITLRLLERAPTQCTTPTY